MAKILYLFLLLSAFLASFTLTAKPVDPGLETGVSRSLAMYRKEVVSNVNYQLSLDIPVERKEAIGAIEKLSFKLKSNLYPLQLDFKVQSEKLKKLKVNGVSIPINHISEHIVIATKYLKTGNNVLEINFEAGEAALNRNADYLYTLFVPDRARTSISLF